MSFSWCLFRAAAGRILIGLLVLASTVNAQERFRKTPPLPEPRQELKLPAIESHVLANGLTVTAANLPGQGIMTITIIVRAGDAHSPPKLPGLAAVTARMVGGGTKVLSAADIENFIEETGTDFSVSVTMEHSLFKIHVLEEYLDRMLVILRQIFLEPVFTERELTAVKRTYYYELREKRSNGEVSGMRQMVRLLFAGHPYMKATYAEDVIKFINLRDVISFYSAYYRPANIVFLVTGNMGLNSAVRKISQHFNMWPAHPVEFWQPPPPVANEKNRICFMEIPMARDATVFIGNSLPFTASDPDYFPFAVLNHILGGTTSNRLFMKLRESKGYAYYAFSETEFYLAGGLYWIKARSKLEDVNNIIRETINELKNISSAGFSPNEIEEAKSYLIGNFPLKIERPADLAETLAAITALNLGDSHWHRAIDNVMLVNLERVEEVALKYMSAPPVVLVLGKADLLTELIKEFPAIEVFDQFGSPKFVMTKGEKTQ